MRAPLEPSREIGQGGSGLRSPHMDTRSPEQRHRIMAAVKSKDTTPELALRAALFAVGVRGWRCHYKRAPGKPDLAWPALRVAVFVDGAFWHGHSSRYRPGRSGEYWDRKIAANIARDRRVDRELERTGWLVVRLWDFEVRKARDDAVAAVIAALSSRISDGFRPPEWWPLASAPPIPEPPASAEASTPAVAHNSAATAYTDAADPQTAHPSPPAQQSPHRA